MVEPGKNEPVDIDLSVLEKRSRKLTLIKTMVLTFFVLFIISLLLPDYQPLDTNDLSKFYDADKAAKMEDKVVYKKEEPEEELNILDQLGLEFAPNPNYELKPALTYYNLERTKFQPNLGSWTSVNPAKLVNLANFEQVNKKPFSQAQLRALRKYGFFISPGPRADEIWGDDPNERADRNDDWTTLYMDISGKPYKALRKPHNAVFISSDFLMHLFHRMLEKELIYIEEEYLHKDLYVISQRMFEAALDKYSKANNPTDKESYMRITTFFLIPKLILEPTVLDKRWHRLNMDPNWFNQQVMDQLEKVKPQIPPQVYQIARKELELILSADGVTDSPLFAPYLGLADVKLKQDYTQFKPRGHYRRNSLSYPYFIAVKWYGSNLFLTSSRELTFDAARISILMRRLGLLKNWDRIRLISEWFVGPSDDLEIPDYLTALDNLGVKELDLTSDQLMELQSYLDKLDSPRIQSTIVVGESVFGTSKQELLDKVKGFRFIGPKFTPDAFVFTSLTQGDEAPDPDTGQKLPSFTTALTMMSAMGIKTADPLLDNWLREKAPNSNKVFGARLADLKSYFSNLTETDWTSNLYWGWLYALKSLQIPETERVRYPYFMRNSRWDTKSLQTILGSWTELKYNTLLYAKAGAAEMGGAAEEKNPSVPKGYVEPNIYFFDRLISLVRALDFGLGGVGIISDYARDRNQSFIKYLAFLRQIAVKEIENQVIPDDDFEELRLISHRLRFLADPLDMEKLTEREARSALISDVFTDAVEDQVLYEATGLPNYIWVAVSDVNGTRLTKGLVYSYYEFSRPISGGRLTLDDWHELNQDTRYLPSQPSWAKQLIVE